MLEKARRTRPSALGKDPTHGRQRADKKKRLGEEGAKPKRIRYKPITR